MIGIRGYIPVIVLVLLAILFQGVFSNAITIGNATPNFFVAFALVIAAVYPSLGSVFIGFLLGLLYNLFCGGTVGTMALVLTLLTFVVVALFSRMEGSSFLFVFVTLLVCGFLADILYGVLAGTFVSGISVSEAMMQRALPCGVYDALITVLLYPIPALFARIVENRQQGSGDWGR